MIIVDVTFVFLNIYLYINWKKYKRSYCIYFHKNDDILLIDVSDNDPSTR